MKGQAFGQLRPLAEHAASDGALFLAAAVVFDLDVACPQMILDLEV